MDLQQQNDRIGMFTGSQIHRLFGKRDGWKTYCDEIIDEILTGEKVKESGKYQATEWGKMYEPVAAKRLQEFHAFTYYGGDNPAFFTHPTKLNLGCSPDGLSETHLIEIKCPFKTTNHRNRIVTGIIDEDYYHQCQFNMMVTGKEKAIFASFDPRIIDEKWQLFTKEIGFDENWNLEFSKVFSQAQTYIHTQIKHFI